MAVRVTWPRFGPEWNRTLVELAGVATIGVLATCRSWAVLAGLLAAAFALAVEVRS